MLAFASCYVKLESVLSHELACNTSEQQNRHQNLFGVVRIWTWSLQVSLRMYCCSLAQHIIPYLVGEQYPAAA